MNMTRTVPTALAFVTLAFAQDVTYNFDQDATFSKFQTYKWVEIPGGVKLDNLTAKQLTSALEAELGMKGLTKTDSDNANLYMGYQVALNQEKQITVYDTGFNTRWGYGPHWGGTGTTTATSSTLTIGSFALDMYDSSQKQLVWRGVATKTIDTGAKPDKRLKSIQKGVAKLLKNYPPQKK